MYNKTARTFQITIFYFDIKFHFFHKTIYNATLCYSPNLGRSL